MNLTDFYIQQEISKLQTRYSVFEIYLKDLLDMPSIKCNGPVAFNPVEKSRLHESNIEVKYLHNNRLVAYVCVKRDTKLIFKDCNITLHLIILFGQLKLNGKTFIPQEHLILHSDTFIKSEFVYFQVITKHLDNMET
eukprot:NODE_814_length_3983_cov_0.318229.p3 type:complete len:137 gc:universal NODE_814_length_3983_cov_0.318229:1570-1980(+)